MSLIRRLLKLDETPVQQAIKALEKSAKPLEEKFKEDPCAADPTRKECRGEFGLALVRSRGRVHHD